MTLAAGSRLGPYEVVSLLGAGGMGEVYRARDPRLQRDVAVKVLPSHLSDDAEALARFEREARAVAALSHPNILSIFDFGRDAGITYSVTELLEGETLRDALLPGPLPPRRTIEIAAALADALFAAHARGLVHRDLKPENVFLTSDGVVKILDFGLARDMRRTGASDNSRTPTVADTVPGTVLGTFSYMSPEQARGEIADSRSDVFALGSVLYEMLTGERAFQRDTPVETLAAVLRDEPARLREAGEPASQKLRTIVARCLEKSPLDRYQTARDVALALRAHASEASGASPSDVRRDALDSVAVLPFENVPDDPDTRYLSDAIAESVTRALSRIDSLRVISRSAVARFRGNGVDPIRAGRELAVRTVVAGRMTVRGDALSMDLELVDVSDGRQIWAERYQRSVADVYPLEEEVVSGIVGRLRPKLEVASTSVKSRTPAPNADAYQLYLKGRYYWNRRPEKGFLQAPEYFEKAIEADPSFALPYSGLADCYITFGSWEAGVLPPNEAFLKARTLARQALEMNDRSAEAHASLGYALFHYDWNFVEAEKKLLRAIELDPGYSAAHHWYSHLALPLGRVEDSKRESLIALAVDPHDFIMNAHLAWHDFFSRNYDGAIENAAKMSIIAHHFWSPFFSGLALEQKGMLAPAIDRLRQAVERAPDSSYAAAALGHAYGIAGDRSSAEHKLEELHELARRRYVPAYDLAIVKLGLSELDEALRFLEASFEERSSWLIHLNVDPRLDPLRDRPEFQLLTARVGLPSVRMSEKS
jgi:eukaryotic-like serine/threonine-protein kinase